MVLGCFGVVGGMSSLLGFGGSVPSKVVFGCLSDMNPPRQMRFWLGCVQSCA